MSTSFLYTRNDYMDLFDYMRENNMEKESPLAARLRPRTIDEIVGQKHILAKDKLLYRAIKATCLGAHPAKEEAQPARSARAKAAHRILFNFIAYSFYSDVCFERVSRL